MENGGNGVLIRFSDGTEAQGDILVGADGAYSAVRQGLYAKMKKANTLPNFDSQPLPFSTVCLVGQTRVLTPDEFPDIALEECQFRNVVGDNRPYAVSLCFLSASPFFMFLFLTFCIFFCGMSTDTGGNISIVFLLC